MYSVGLTPLCGCHVLEPRCNQVKKSDHESFLCTLLLPERARAQAFAVRAFAAEVAAVRDSVSDKTIGMMRMQGRYIEDSDFYELLLMMCGC